MSGAVNQMAVEGKSIVGNATQKMNQLSSQAQAEYRRALGDINMQISKVRAKGTAGYQATINELNKQKAALQQAHAEATSGNKQGDALGNLMNGTKKLGVAKDQAIAAGKKAGRMGAKYVRDVAKVRAQVVAGQVPGGTGGVGGRKSRTRRKRRRKGKKSRRSRRKKRKGKKSRRSRRRKRKGRKSRRKKRRTRRRR